MARGAAQTGCAKKLNESFNDMKTTFLTRCASGALLAGALLLQPAAAIAQAVTFDVNLQSAQFTLYCDPYNGNQIKLGGFSGLYPVPGKPDSFYTITDRGAAPDFVDANTNAYKAFAIRGEGEVTPNATPNGPSQNATPNDAERERSWYQ